MMPLYLELLLTFMKIGVLAFGGGYAAIPLIRDQVVDAKAWMTAAEFTEIMAMDELTPGPIIINAASFVGAKTAGIPGAIIATLGSILPSFCIALLLLRVYAALRSDRFFNGVLEALRGMVAGLILATAVSTALSAFFPAGTDFIAVFIAVLSFFCLQHLHAGTVATVLGGGILGLLLYTFL